MERRHNHQVEIPLWEKLLADSTFSSPFQTPDFYRCCNSVERFSADVFAIEESGVYQSLMVVTVQRERGIPGYFSRRGIIYGGPLHSGGQKSLACLLNWVNEYYEKKLIYIETRNLFDYRPYLTVYDACGWNYQPWLNVRNQLKNATLDTIMARFNYNRRREIRQSLAEGATWSEVQSMEEMDSVYEILSRLYKKRLKLPLPSKDFFVRLWQNAIMKAFAVWHNGKIIGGAFCPVMTGKAIYTMYYCGERNYHPRIFPTHLAILAALEYGLKAGCRYLDFMGAGRPDREYGVRKYKLEFGGDLVEEGRFIRIMDPFLYRLGKVGLTVLSKAGK